MERGRKEVQYITIQGREGKESVEDGKRAEAGTVYIIQGRIF
jgi:hypothetical protein